MKRKKRKSNEEAQREAEEGMDQAADHAGEEWADYAYRFLIKYAKGQRYIFPPDVWEAGLRESDSNRAFGSVMQRAIHDNIMVRIEFYGPGGGHDRPFIGCWNNPNRHNAPTPVYESLIYSPGTTQAELSL